MLTSDPVILYSPDGKRQKRIASVDAMGWINSGWSLTPVAIDEITAPTSAENETKNPLLPEIIEAEDEVVATPISPESVKTKASKV
jgi:hypothetical protein